MTPKVFRPTKPEPIKKGTTLYGTDSINNPRSRTTGPVTRSGDRLIRSEHLVDLVQRSVGRSEVLCEQTLAHTAITRPYISGTRGFARWSGNTTRSVREIAGPTGGLSEFKFLWTTTRGVSSALADERDSMELRYSDTRTEGRSTSSKSSTPAGGQEEVLALEEKELKNPSNDNAPLSARIGERAQEVLDKGLKTLATLDELSTLTEPGQILTMLDPGLDIWAEVEEGNGVRTAVEPLGRRAWSLAVMCGLEDVVLSVSDMEDLTGLSKRGVQALLARMTKADQILVRKVRKGRSFEYEINWASRFRKDGDHWDDCFDRDNIRKARASKDSIVQATSARRGTPAGYLAFLHSVANAKREQYLVDHPLPANASEEFKALVAEGDEMALYEYFKTQEDAVSVPASPAALEAPLPAPQPERVYEPVRMDPGALRAMKARVCKMPA